MKFSFLSFTCASRSHKACLACIALASLATLAVADPSAAPLPENQRQVQDSAREDVRLPAREEILQNEYLRNALSRSHAGLRATRGPHGELTIDLQGRFQSVATARIDADGEIETTCLESHESLEHFLAAHPGGGEAVHRDSVSNDLHTTGADHED